MAESLLFRHCSTSVNTGKAISGDVSADKKISKIHGEYPFNVPLKFQTYMSQIRQYFFVMQKLLSFIQQKYKCIWL